MAMNFNKKFTREEEVRIEKEYKLLRFKNVVVFDEISPGWESGYMHGIMGTEDSPDIVHELPGGVFIRGWDITGAINARQVGKPDRRKTQRTLRRRDDKRRAALAAQKKKTW